MMGIKPPALGYFLGIGGIAMANFACLLHDAGFEVVGSDRGVYPPAKGLLDRQKIPYRIGYDASRLLSVIPRVDFCVLGNAVSFGNPELEVFLDRRMPVFSLPEAIRMFLGQGRRSLVVAGTHGKTTTASAIAWTMVQAGLDPSCLIGGIPHGFGKGSRFGGGPWCVLEGDEYDTACFDKHPKAFHYAPFGLVLTHAEFDHADIYRDLGHVREAFRFLIGLIPPEGFLLAFSGIQGLEGLCGGLRGRRFTYGELPNDSFSLGELKMGAAGMEFFVRVKLQDEEYRIETPLKGPFNAQNLTAAFGASVLAGVSPKAALEGLRGFSGVQRRLEKIHESERLCLIEDFAHHPTAVHAVLKTLRAYYPTRELRVVFEPRSNTMRRKVLQDQLIMALAQADRVFLRPLDRVETIPEGQCLDLTQVQRRLRELGTEASIEPDLGPLVRKGLESRTKPVILALLSNGDIHGLKQRFLIALEKEEP